MTAAILSDLHANTRSYNNTDGDLLPSDPGFSPFKSGKVTFKEDDEHSSAEDKSSSLSTNAKESNEKKLKMIFEHSFEESLSNPDLYADENIVDDEEWENSIVQKLLQ